MSQRTAGPLRVLVLAYACEPGAGSEPGAGWLWTTAAAERHQVTLVTRSNNAAAINAAIETSSSLDIRPIYIDLPAWVSWWKRGSRGVHLYYLFWQILAARTARRLHRSQPFDLGHHLTFGSDWFPSALTLVPQLPFVWGPVGGATGVPWGMWKWLGFIGVLREALRALLVTVARRTVGAACARRASLIIAQNDDTKAALDSYGPCIIEPNVAIHPSLLSLVEGTSDALSSAKGKQAVFVGRLVPLKGLRLAISALAHPQAAKWSLHVFGEGPEGKAARRLVLDKGLTDRVTFHGVVSRVDVMAAMSAADALIAPSLHEAAGWAIAEALSLNTPVIAFRHGGPTVLLQGGNCGHLVKPEPAADIEIARCLARMTNARSTHIPNNCAEAWLATRLPARIGDLYRTALTGGIR